MLLLPESERRRGGAWDGPVEREERDILGIVCYGVSWLLCVVARERLPVRVTGLG